jgi:hypothetical protein
VTARLRIGAGIDFCAELAPPLRRDSPPIETERASFTFFEARSINFAIVVYAMIMHVDPRPALKHGTTEGNMAKKAKKAKAKKTAKKKKK